MAKTVATRFAPSPTGFMHIGNLRTALYSYLIARHANGNFILRIEDTDRERLVEGAVDVILKTLDVTGLHYNEGPGVGGEHGPYVQSERLPIYKKYAEELVRKGYAYYCFCSKERLESLHEESGVGGGYDRHCRNLSEEEIQKNLAAGLPYVIRQKMPLDGHTTYTDEVFGEIGVDNCELQDQILIKADGYPTYNFCHIIDDHLMGVTHVVRGSEYLTSTPKYVLLYDAFGWERPTYVHLPLLMGKNEDGSVSKLSKRHGAVSFEALVNMGYLPEAIINYIAFLGWSPKGEDSEREFFSLSELEEAFDIAGISKSPAVFDYDKLAWFNGEYIKRMDDDAYRAKAKAFLPDDLPANLDRNLLLTLLKGRISSFGEIPEKIAFFRALPAYDVSLFENKKNKVTVESASPIVRALEGAVASVDDFSNDALYASLLSLSESLGVKSGAVMWCARIAVSGTPVTPGGATEIMATLGREETLARIHAATMKF